MKKILLTTAACGLVMAAAPAHAEIDLGIGGYFKGYGAFVDQDEGGVAGNEDANDFDFIRDTEVHFSGETTLDNGLTVGFHLETDVDGTDGDTTVDESYAYFAGSWGRFNFGDEDGAAYLLQVAAPSADSNIDGIRQYVQPVNYNALLDDGFLADAAARTFIQDNGAFDYDHDTTGKSTKLTYLSPIMNGFQAGLSFTPDSDGRADDLEGIGLDDVAGTQGEAYEGSLRYEGEFEGVGIIFGGGYSHQEVEATNFTAAGAVPAGAVQAALTEGTDDRQAWNVGLDLDFGPFGIGAIYKEDNWGEYVTAVQTATTAARTSDDEETWVVGADYTTGPFKLGATYFDQDNSYGVENLDTKRYSGGVTYTYGPGMTFRGSIGYIEHDATNIGGTNSNDVDATYVTLGTQINF